MRVRAFTVAAIPLAISCSDADTASNGATGGGNGFSATTGGTTSGAVGGAGSEVSGIGGTDASPGAGGGTGITTGGTGNGTGGTTATATGGTTTTPSTGGTTTTPGTGGSGDTENTGGATTTPSTGGSGDTENTGGTGNTGDTGGGEFAVGEGAFVTTCGWSGYAWTDADALGSTIEPASFESTAAGAELCANGTVAADADWNGYAILAINVGQATSDVEESVDIATDGTGVYADLTNNAGSTLRIQIQDALGGDDPAHRWCAEYTGPGVIPWSDFNTQCWEGGAGTAYDGEPINAVLVLVPGDDDTATDFDFCVNKVEPDGSSSCEGGGNDNTGGTSGNTGGTSGNTGGTGSTDCTDNPNPDEPNTSCATWLEWGTCADQWMVDGHICDATCGRCEGGNTNTGGSTGNTGGNTSTGGTTGGTTLPSVDTLPGVQNGWVTRYWDCCKPHCAWSANGPAIPTCDIGDNSQGVNDQANSCQGGPSYMCHSFAPWSAGDQAAYGFVAFNSGNCGDCYLLEFTGTGDDGAGSSHLAGKRMIVQKTNTGSDVNSGQMDLLLPGGGTGQFDGCTAQFGANDFGAQYGGFRTTCGADASCIRSKCEAAFGESPELMAGCDWYINWYGMADNPDMRFAPISCPSEIRNISGIG